MEKPKFHLTIKDNETGEVLHDVDTCVILGAYDYDNERTSCIALIASGSTQILSAIAGMDDIKEVVFEEHPRLKLIYEIKDTMDRLKQALENEPGEDHGDEEESGEN